MAADEAALADDTAGIVDSPKEKADMPYSMDNMPRPATNWTKDEQKKCIAAANAVLASGKPEQDAIFACINAAGRTENPGGKKTMGIFERLGEMFAGFAGTLAAEEKAMSRKKLSMMAEEMGVQMTDAQMEAMMEQMADMPEAEAMAAARKRMMAMRGKKETFAVYKQADGAYRWFGWVSNHFRDNDNPREILSAKAHRDYVAFVDKTGNYPELWLWHVPGSRIGKADMVDFADGFLVESGLFDPGLEGVAEKLAKETDPLTMSHGFVRTMPMDAKGVTDGYIQFEASATPQSVEANPWTGFSTLKEADMPLNPDKKAFLAKYLPVDVITSLEGKTDELRKAAEAAGVDWKAVEDPPSAGAGGIQATETPTTTEAPKIEDMVSVLAGPLAEAVAERLQLTALSTTIADVKAKTDGLTALSTRIEAIEKALAVVQKSDDEKIAAQMTPKVSAIYSWFGKAASASKETILDPDDPKDKELEKAKPSAFADFIANAARPGTG